MPSRRIVFLTIHMCLKLFKLKLLHFGAGVRLGLSPSPRFYGLFHVTIQCVNARVFIYIYRSLWSHLLCYMTICYVEWSAGFCIWFKPTVLRLLYDRACWYICAWEFQLIKAVVLCVVTYDHIYYGARRFMFWIQPMVRALLHMTTI
jgi:hypothetical protein